MEIEAPFVAKKAKAGQFIIFRIDELSERVPLTIAGYDREKGTVENAEAVEKAAGDDAPADNEQGDDVELLSENTAVFP